VLCFICGLLVPLGDQILGLLCSRVVDFVTMYWDQSYRLTQKTSSPKVKYVYYPCKSVSENVTGYWGDNLTQLQILAKIFTHSKDLRI